MLFGILCLVITGIIWIIPGAIISNCAKKGLSLDFIQGMTALVFICLAVPICFFGSTRFPLISWIVLPASGVLNYLCFSAAGKAMKKGPSGLTWAMMQSSFIMPFLMGVIFFQVPSSFWRWSGLAVMVAAMYFMGQGGAGAKEDDKTEHSGKGVWLFYSILAFVCAGGSQCCFNLPSYFIAAGEGGVESIILRSGINGIGGFGIFLCSRLWNKNSFNSKGTFVSILLLFVTSLLAMATVLTGLDTLAACNAGAIGYPISLGTTIAAFLIYTSFRLKERFSREALIGVGLCFAGIILLAM
jgi:drug/metabolite transporter (DMT)-like permease